MSGQPHQGIVAAGLMPHAPVLVPAVGREREREAQATVRSMRMLSRRLMDLNPARMILISPHSPRQAGKFGWWGGERLRGDLDRFGCPEAGVDLPNDLEFLESLRREGEALGLGLWEIMDRGLDHGAVVPLCFLVEAGWAGPTSVLGLNYPEEEGLETLGSALARAAAAVGGTMAVVASGDMSHRLREGAPAGFHPQACAFDRRFIELLRRGDYASLGCIDPELQALAAEDVVDATRVAAAAVANQSANHEVLSYEGPFGVGYGVALLYERQGRRRRGGECLPDIAKQAVATQLTGLALERPEAAEDLMMQRSGVFVTIRNRQGELRGCRGTLEPQRSNLVEETQSIALSSAFNDQRFESVRLEELEELHFEVSVVSETEEVVSVDALDPTIFGVIVVAEDGRRGVMLPGVEGLDTVEKQLEATRRKAQIRPDEPVKMWRFKVERFDSAS